MTARPGVVVEFPAGARRTEASPSTPRPFYWAVRRELWENRSVTLGPPVVSGLVLVGFLVSSVTLAARTREALALDPAERADLLVRPYELAAALMILTAFVVSVFYCLDALYGERHDRAVLFWKSMPVSDAVTVFAKASVPLVVLPALAAVAAGATQAVMFAANAAVLAASGVSVAPLWDDVRIVERPLVLLYGLAAMSLWLAPVYAWLLLVSAWARRAPFAWAALPVFAACAVEQVAFGTTNALAFLQYRLCGSFSEAFGTWERGRSASPPLPPLAPLHFLALPELWGGLAVAAVFLAVAVRLRRARGAM